MQFRTNLVHITPQWPPWRRAIWHFSVTLVMRQPYFTLEKHPLPMDWMFLPDSIYLLSRKAGFSGCILYGSGIHPALHIKPVGEPPDQQPLPFADGLCAFA